MSREKSATFRITGISNLDENDVVELNKVFDAISQEVLGVFLDLQDKRIPLDMKVMRLQTFSSVLPTCKRLLELARLSASKCLEGENKEKVRATVVKIVSAVEELEKLFATDIYSTTTGSTDTLHRAADLVISVIENGIGVFADVDKCSVEKIEIISKTLMSCVDELCDYYIFNKYDPSTAPHDLNTLTSSVSSSLLQVAKQYTVRKEVMLQSGIPLLTEATKALLEYCPQVVPMARGEIPIIDDIQTIVRNALDDGLIACKIVTPFTAQIIMPYEHTPLTAHFDRIRSAIATCNQAQLSSTAQDVIALVRTSVASTPPETSRHILDAATGLIKSAKICLDDVKNGARPHMIELETMMEGLNRTIIEHNVQLITPNAFALETFQPAEAQQQSFDLLFAAKKIVDDGMSALISQM